MEEIWKPLIGFECCYEISNLGKIRSYKRQGSKSEFLTYKITGYGYPAVNLRCNGKKFFKAIHRLLAEHFIPNPDNLEMVNHKDNDKSNYNLDNLEWVTRGQNIAHGFLIKGRKRKGWRLSTLQYLNKVHKFKSVDELLIYLENTDIFQIKKEQK
jgi:hypothetical protein